MQTRRLGPFDACALGLGCMDMSQSYGAHDDKTSSATLRRALELGITLFDTANVYGSGHDEELLGCALKPHRQRIVLATKVGLTPTWDRSTRNEGPPTPCSRSRSQRERQRRQ